MKAWEIRLEKMSDYDKQYLITGIEDGWIDPNDDDLHIYYKLIGIDEHPIITWFKRLFHREEEKGEKLDTNSISDKGH